MATQLKDCAFNDTVVKKSDGSYAFDANVFVNSTASSVIAGVPDSSTLLKCDSFKMDVPWKYSGNSGIITKIDASVKVNDSCGDTYLGVREWGPGSGDIVSSAFIYPDRMVISGGGITDCGYTRTSISSKGMFLHDAWEYKDEHDVAHMGYVEGHFTASGATTNGPLNVVATTGSGNITKLYVTGAGTSISRLDTNGNPEEMFNCDISSGTIFVHNLDLARDVQEPSCGTRPVVQLFQGADAYSSAPEMCGSRQSFILFVGSGIVKDSRGYSGFPVFAINSPY